MRGQSQQQAQILFCIASGTIDSPAAAVRSVVAEENRSRKRRP
jgi:hypothetical protein